MGQDALVSVVIPCFNGARWLREAIDSAIGQTWPNVEVVVVDDGSSDDSVAIARSYGDPVRVLLFPNGGPSVARNRGLEAARGGWIQFLDADDLLLPRKIEACLAVVEGADDAPLSLARTFREDGATTPSWRGPLKLLRARPTPFDPDHALATVLTTEILPHQWLHRRERLVRLGGFRPSMRWLEDIDLNVRLALSGVRLRLVPEVLALGRDHSAPGRQRLDPRSVPAGIIGERVMIDEIRAAGALDDRVRPILASRLAWAARRGWRAGLKDEAREAWAVAKELHPRPASTGFPLYNAVTHALGMERTERVVDRVLGLRRKLGR